MTTRLSSILIATAAVTGLGAANATPSFISPSSGLAAVLSRLSDVGYPAANGTRESHVSEAQDKELVAAALKNEFGTRFEIVEASYNSAGSAGFEALAVRDTTGGSNGQIYIIYVGTNDMLDGYADVELAAETKFSPQIEPKDWKDIHMLFLDLQIGQAMSFFDRVKSKSGGHQIILTGHSLGGLLAQVVAGSREVKAVTFSAPGVPTSLAARNNIFFNKTFDIVDYSRSTDIVARLGEHLGTSVRLGGRTGSWTYNYLAQHSISALSGEMIASFPKGDLVEQPARNTEKAEQKSGQSDNAVSGKDKTGDSIATQRFNDITDLLAGKHAQPNTPPPATESLSGAGAAEKSETAKVDIDDDDEMTLEIRDKEKPKDRDGKTSQPSDGGPEKPSTDDQSEVKISPQTYRTQEQAVEQELRAYEKAREEALKRMVPKPDVDPLNPAIVREDNDQSPHVTIEEKPDVDPRPDQEDEFVSATSEIVAVFMTGIRPEVDPPPPDMRDPKPPPSPRPPPDVDKSALDRENQLPLPAAPQQNRAIPESEPPPVDAPPAPDLVFRPPRPSINSQAPGDRQPEGIVSNCKFQPRTSRLDAKVFVLSLADKDGAEPQIGRLAEIMRPKTSSLWLAYSDNDVPVFLSNLESGLTQDFDLFVVDESQSSQSFLNTFIEDPSVSQRIPTPKFVDLAGQQAEGLISFDNTLIVVKDRALFAEEVAKRIADNYRVENIGVFGVTLGRDTPATGVLVQVGEALAKGSQSAPRMIATSIGGVDLLNALSDGVNVILTDPGHFEEARRSLGSGFGAHDYKLVAVGDTEVTVATSQIDDRIITMTNTFGDGMGEWLAGLSTAWATGATIDFGDGGVPRTCAVAGQIVAR